MKLKKALKIILAVFAAVIILRTLKELSAPQAMQMQVFKVH